MELGASQMGFMILCSMILFLAFRLGITQQQRDKLLKENELFRKKLGKQSNEQYYTEIPHREIKDRIRELKGEILKKALRPFTYRIVKVKTQTNRED